jgi:hypothetical protein
MQNNRRLAPVLLRVGDDTSVLKVDGDLAVSRYVGAAPLVSVAQP